MNFINLWNENVTFPGNDSIKGFLQVYLFHLLPSFHSLVCVFQPRFLNGTFNFTDPRHCSIHDPQKGTCFLNAANRDGFYEDAPIVVRLCPLLVNVLTLIHTPYIVLPGKNTNIFGLNGVRTNNEPLNSLRHMMLHPLSSFKEGRRHLSI